MRELTPEEGRVLGALVEKELTTPQGYPLTDTALVAACNQTTSREPVVSYDTATVRVAVRALREEGLLRTVHRTGERSDKHRHELESALGLSRPQTALLGLLLLRGPQTLAELRARAERWHPFADVEQVEEAVAGLTDRAEPLAVRLERQPGRKEARYAQLLTASAGPAGPVLQGAARPADTPSPGLGHDLASSQAHLATAEHSGQGPLAARVADLAEQVQRLGAQVQDLQAQVRALQGG